MVTLGLQVIFDIFMNPQFKIYYGHVDDVYHMEYYNDILDFNEIDYWSTTPEQIVELLINEIDHNHYMVVYLRKKITGNREHLFYGYDKDKELFYTSSLSEGRFRGMTLTFEEVKKYFKDFREYNIAFPEGYGKTYTIQEYNNHKQIIHSSIYHTGLACLPCMEDRVYQYIRDKEFIIKDHVLKGLARELKWNLQKLSDHRYIIFSSMQWLLTKSHSIDNSIYPIIAAYEKCCKTMKQLSNMAAKFELTENWEILDRIDSLLKERYVEEKRILSAFIDKIGSMYFGEKVYPPSNE